MDSPGPESIDRTAFAEYQGLRFQWPGLKSRESGGYFRTAQRARYPPGGHEESARQQRPEAAEGERNRRGGRKRTDCRDRRRVSGAALHRAADVWCDYYAFGPRGKDHTDYGSPDLRCTTL